MSIGLAAFTLFHVAISLVGIASGFVVMFGLLKSQRMDGWTAIFLWTTVATSVTGFFFPVTHILPSHIVGIISLIVLVPAIYARYSRRLAGHWRLIYVITAMIALYLNFFVLIVQSFRKIPMLTALAPTQSEPPFAVTQLIALVAFIAVTIVAARKFHVAQPVPVN